MISKTRTASIPLLALIFLTAGFAFHAGRGLDVTDESYYLLCSRMPEKVLAIASQFGHYTGLIFRLTGYRLALFRLAGLLLLLAAGLLFAVHFERFLGTGNSLRADTGTGRMRLPAILTGVLVYYGLWLPTPSYNWLNLISIFLMSAALLAASGSALPAKRSWPWAVLLGVSITLSFLSRPPSAAALALVSLVWILTLLPAPRRILFAAIAAVSAAGFLALHILVFEKGLAGFYQEMEASLRLNRCFGIYGLRPLFFRALKELRFLLKYFFWTAVLLIPLLAAAREAVRRSGAGRTACMRILILTVFAFWLFLGFQKAWQGGQPLFWNNGFSGMVFCLVLWLSGQVLFPGRSPARQRRELLAFLLAAAGAGFAFSSGNGVLRQMSFAFVFPAAASLAIASGLEEADENKNLTQLLCVLWSATAVFILSGAYQHPYRVSGSLASQTEPVTLNMLHGKINMDPVSRDYADHLRRAAEAAGWTEGTPLLDLTESPGAAVILNAFTPVTPWLYGIRYPGFMKTALAMADPRDLRKAWVLTTPQRDSVSTPETVLRDQGLEFPEGYTAVGEFQSGYQNQPQILWKPVR